MDVVVATAQYEEAMLWCQGRFDQRGRDLLLVYDQIAYHCNAPYHAKRNLRLMCEVMYERPLTKEDHEGLYRGHVWLGTAISAQKKASEALRIAELRYQVGAGTSLEVVEAQAALGNADFDLADAHFRQLLARAQLNLALGFVGLDC